MKINFAHWLAASAFFAGASACPSYPLVAGGGNGEGTVIGYVTVSDSDSDDSMLKVSIVVNRDLTPGGSDDSSPTKVYELHAEANCELSEFPLTKKGAPKNGLFDVALEYDSGETSASVDIPKPEGCGENPILVAVHTAVEKKGGVLAYNDLFPVAVKFRLSIDAGDDNGSSYFNTRFSGNSVLNGLEIDGYCVDVDHTITLNKDYSATAYSFLEEEGFTGTNIDKPDNLDLVAWAINNYVPGNPYTEDIDGDGVFETYTLSSGTLQRAIWYIIDNTDSTAGLGNFVDAWALFISEAATAHNGYVPGCGDLLPIVLIPDDGSVQHTIIQTTFAALRVPCESHEETAWAVMPGTGRIGKQFASKNWATYVEYTPDC